MEQILLIDPDPEHACAAASALKTLRCEVAICPNPRTAAALIARRAFAVIVAAVPPKAGWDSFVDTVRHVALQLPQPPEIICLLRGPYCGPSERVYAARKGFKVIYER